MHGANIHRIASLLRTLEPNRPGCHFRLDFSICPFLGMLEARIEFMTTCESYRCDDRSCGFSCFGLVLHGARVSDAGNV